MFLAFPKIVSIERSVNDDIVEYIFLTMQIVCGVAYRRGLFLVLSYS